MELKGLGGEIEVKEQIGNIYIKLKISSIDEYQLISKKIRFVKIEMYKLSKKFKLMDRLLIIKIRK